MQTIQQILNFSVGKLTVGNIASAIVIYIICRMVTSSLSGTINKLIAKINKDENLQGFLKTVVNVMLHFVAMCIVAEAVGIPISSLLAVLGMLGLAISLSVQGALANLSNGILLLITRPFKVGDYIVEDKNKNEGTVLEIKLFYTKLRTVDDRIVILPNGDLANSSLTNLHLSPNRRVCLTVGISYKADMRRRFPQNAYSLP